MENVERDTTHVNVWCEMRIAIIIERANIGLGGAERSVFELAKAISKLCPKVDILAATGRANAENTHILCRDISGKRASYSTFERSLKRHLSENHYDIIHSVLPFDFADVYQPRGGTYAESILRNAASYQNKFIESYKKLTAFANFRRTILLRAERKLCQQPNGPKIIAISQYVAEQFKRHYAVSDERIELIPNGIKIHTAIDTEPAVKPRLAPAPVAGAASATGAEANAPRSFDFAQDRFTRGFDRLRSQILAQLGQHTRNEGRGTKDETQRSRDEPVLFLFVANNFRLKGLSVLIKAMHLAASQGTPRPFFIIVAGNGKMRKYLRLAKKLDPITAERKIYFLGHVMHIQNVLSISDVAVLPTFYDPCSRYILEALAAGVPVITTSFNGATDLFVDNRHGKVIDTPENVPALAEAIRYFTITENIQAASRAIAADNLKEKISISRVAKQLMDVYEKIQKSKCKM